MQPAIRGKVSVKASLQCSQTGFRNDRLLYWTISFGSEGIESCVHQSIVANNALVLLSFYYILSSQLSHTSNLCSVILWLLCNSTRIFRENIISTGFVVCTVSNVLWSNFHCEIIIFVCSRIEMYVLIILYINISTLYYETFWSTISFM